MAFYVQANVASYFYGILNVSGVNYLLMTFPPKSENMCKIRAGLLVVIKQN